MLFLLLGAIVNLAEARGCALRDIDRMRVRIGPTPPVESNAPTKHPDREWNAFGFRVHAESETDFQATVIRYPGRDEPGVNTDPVSWIIWTFEAGWPLPALGCREVLRGIKGNPLSIRPTEKHLLTELLWPGFAINTVFYAFILWLLFAGPFVLRRRRRIRRGLCPKCGYDLRGSKDASACPECGASVAPSPRHGESSTRASPSPTC